MGDVQVKRTLLGFRLTPASGQIVLNSLQEASSLSSKSPQRSLATGKRERRKSWGGGLIMLKSRYGRVAQA